MEKHVTNLGELIHGGGGGYLRNFTVVEMFPRCNMIVFIAGILTDFWFVLVCC